MDIAGIRLRGVCKVFHVDCTGVALQRGDYAVVQTERGASLGEVIRRIDGPARKGDKPPFGKVLRVASAEDIRAHQENTRRESEAVAFCNTRIAERGLPMKLVR